jgi:hypothetical protein
MFPEHQTKNPAVTVHKLQQIAKLLWIKWQLLLLLNSWLNKQLLPRFDFQNDLVYNIHYD